MILDWFKKHILKLSVIYFVILIYVIIELKLSFTETLEYLSISIFTSFIFIPLNYFNYRFLKSNKNKLLGREYIEDAKLEYALIVMHFVIFLSLFTDVISSDALFLDISCIITNVLCARKFKVNGSIFKQPWGYPSPHR